MLYRDERIDDTTTASILIDPGGWLVEYYRDDDGGSGWGENGEVARWYGPRSECIQRVKNGEGPSAESDWAPL